MGESVGHHIALSLPLQPVVADGRCGHQSGDDCENRASGAAADDLTHDGPEIEAAVGGRACDRRNDGLQNLTSTYAADGAGDDVTKIAQIVILQCGAGGVPAADSRDELND